MISFRARLVTMDEIWLYHYDPETKQQSMERRCSCSPRPKNFRVQKCAGKFLASFFWDQDGILLIDYLPKGQTMNAEYYLSLLMQLKDIWKEKRRWKFIKGALFLHDIASANRALATRRNWPTWVSSFLIPHPILRMWPRRTTTCSLDRKNNCNVAIFLPTRTSFCCGDLVGRTIF